MVPIFNIIHVFQDTVLAPTTASAVWLLGATIIGELIVLIPANFTITSQLLFLDGPLTSGLLIRLFFLVAVPIGVGTAIGSTFFYSLAYWGGKPAIDRWGKYFSVSWRDVERAQAKFHGNRFDEIIFFLVRLIPLVPSQPISLAAGVIRMKFVPYWILTAVGSTFKTMLLLLIFGLGIMSL